MSSGYKKVIADKALADETYTEDSVALIRISQTSIHNNKAVQVEAVRSTDFDHFLSMLSVVHAFLNAFHQPSQGLKYLCACIFKLTGNNVITLSLGSCLC